MCEQSDQFNGPFHTFITTDNVDTTTDSDNHMSLNMPPQVPNGEMLGKKTTTRI